MAKQVYRVMAFKWDKRKKEYERKEITIQRDYFEALSTYDRLTPCADMMAVELWEDSMNKHGIAVSRERIRMKDQAGEWDQSGELIG